MHLSEADLVLFVRVESSFGLAGYREAALEGHSQNFLGDLRGHLQTLQADLDQSTIESIGEEAEGEHGFFRESDRAAALLSLWASFEFAVTEYVESHLGGSPDSRSRVKDLRGGVLEAWRTLVTKLFRREFDPRRSKWNEVTALRRVRNHLAHSGVFVGQGDERLRNAIESVPGPSIGEEDLIVFGSGFWFHVRICEMAFAEELVRALNPKVDRRLENYAAGLSNKGLLLSR